MTKLDDKRICVCTAAYNDWVSCNHLLQELDKELSGIGVQAEIVIIDDGSSDDYGRDEIGKNRFTAIQSVRVVELAANQGNQRALAIAIGYLSANVASHQIVMMDTDLEDKPSDVPRLLHKCWSENDRKIIFAERTRRSESLAFRVGYRVYQYLYRLFTGQSISYGNFCVIPLPLLKRLAHNHLLWNHFAAAILCSRLPHDSITAERGRRIYGKSKMNLIGLIIHAFNGFVVNAERFAARMLVIAAIVGVMIFLLLGIAFILRLTIPLPQGFTTLVFLQLGLLLAQTIGAAVVTLFVILSLRLQPQLSPLRDHTHFIERVIFLYEDKLERQ